MYIPTDMNVIDFSNIALSDAKRVTINLSYASTVNEKTFKNSTSNFINLLYNSEIPESVIYKLSSNKNLKTSSHQAYTIHGYRKDEENIWKYQ